MTDNEKIEYLENEIIENDLFNDSQLEVIESLIYWFGDSKRKEMDEGDNIMLDALEIVFEQSSGYFPEYDDEDDDEDWDKEDDSEEVN